MRGFQFAIDTVERMRHRMRDLSGLEVALQRKNIVADDSYVGMLCLGNTPNQDVNLARILRKITCNLLTNKRLRQLRYAQTTLDRIMVGDRHVIHPPLEGCLRISELPQ